MLITVPWGINAARILLAEDHLMFRLGLSHSRAGKSHEVVGGVGRPRAIRLARTLHPDVAVLDLTATQFKTVSMPPEESSEFPQDKNDPSRHTLNQYVMEAVRAGQGYVLKTQATPG
jgi:DNA-binding NarL/FixJ family response regulator